MLVSVVPIGNSRGIRIPKNVLQQLNITDKVEIEVKENELHIKPVVQKPRQGWAEAFSHMHAIGSDKPLMDDFEEDFDSTDKGDFSWEW